MGEGIATHQFHPDDFSAFKDALRRETAHLVGLFKDQAFSGSQAPPTMGIEVEAWLVDRDFLPSPHNEAVLAQANHPLLVPELSKFNVEMNVEPLTLGPQSLSSMVERITSLWAHLQDSAQQGERRALMIGSLPTLRDPMLRLEFMSNFERYRALNEQVLALRSGAPLTLELSGKDHLKVTHQDIMLEAAATSVQYHFAPSADHLVDYFNLSILASAPLVAATANAPYLFGKELWEESRIAVFEQAVNLPSILRLDGHYQRRVTFGNGYVGTSILELFVENTSGYPVLLPVAKPGATGDMHHVKLHNGNIWRWNRPILGTDASGAPQIRIEHRPPSSGPTPVDIVAGLAFYIGLIHGWHLEKLNPRETVSFPDAKANFYRACRHGLGAKFSWCGRLVSADSLIFDQLLPVAKHGLTALGVSQEEIARFLDDVMRPRVQSGRTGAHWQRSWVATHGPDFQGLTEQYFYNQESGLPVHEWPV